MTDAKINLRKNIFVEIDITEICSRLLDKGHIGI